MRKIVLLRHGVTEWNESGRIQGRTDTRLSSEGIRKLNKWHLPDWLRDSQWVCSPLSRTRDSLALLGIHHPVVEPALIEMDWGEWTGRTLSSLRAELGSEFRRSEERGLDFKTAGGESPRMVRQRLEDWLNSQSTEGAPIAVMTHKGVIRAAISLATGWDLTSDYTEKLQRDVYHVFHWSHDGFTLESMNISLRINQD